MRAAGVMVIVAGFIVAWAIMAILYVGFFAKKVSSKQGRQEIKRDVTDTVTFIAKDKDFHKEINKEFRGLYIVIGLVIFALIGTALGLG
jgi:hypothetical protein